jgi:hypothetical protein
LTINKSRMKCGCSQKWPPYKARHTQCLKIIRDPELLGFAQTGVTARLPIAKEKKMKTSISMNCVRLAVLAAATLMPGMAACTYSASANAPVLGAAGGYVSVTVSTQPGCRWSVAKPGTWLSSAASSAGSGTMYLLAASTKVARSGIVRVYPDLITNEISLTDGEIGGRSATGLLLRPILQFTITQY